ncbi:carbohydrate esterase family 4 protein [Gonapodya prolifera JEL478]|uniref:Carbohydrate esterase family 4 protein n=1 Tax=Gonapodya prolifera (strain JEL478) TaxID=1344416 RepID=A0A139AZF0_GONPJ|nr:carbohydrate esterase family 4 protein [Gonapodya prolifera JEL478]|eukprot:KXS21855.1 carbohydrate esterase family 4 protein [Gonapodya prolifera JEL478]
MILFLCSLVAIVCLVTAAAVYLVWWQPGWLVTSLATWNADVLWSFPEQDSADEKFIALSIDDVPTHVTPELLSVLEQNDARATLFVIGSHLERWTESQNVELGLQQSSPPYKSLLVHLRRQGHELGNHLWYDEPSIRLTTVRFRDELIRLDELLFSPGDGKQRWFRPGSGWFNKRMLDVAKSLGYRCVLGSVFPHDPLLRTPRLNAFHIVNRARDGAVIIVHDGRPWTIETLTIALPELRRKGFRFVSIGELYERRSRKKSE